MKNYKIHYTIFYLIIAIFLINCSGTKPDVKPEEVKIYDSEAIRHFMNGEIYALHGNYAMAVLEFQDAVKSDSNSSTIFSSLGEAYIQIGKLDNAKIVLQKAIQIDSLNYMARKYMADIEFSEGNIEYAEKEYNFLSKELTDELDIDYKMGEIYLRTNRVAEALATYENIFRKDRSQIGALERAAEILFLSKNFQKAATYFDFLSQLEPENTEYMKTCADLALMTNNIDKAIKIYKKLILLLPDDQKIKDNLGEILSQIKDDNHKPLEYLNSRIEEDSQNIDNYKNLIFYHLNNNQIDEAISTLEATTQKFSEDAELYFILGSIYREKNDDKKAIEYLDNALIYATDSLEIIQLKATLLEENGEYAASDSLYNILIAKYPQDPVALNNYAYSLATRNKELDKALEYVIRALEIAPDNASYLDTKGWILYNQERYDEAEIYLQKAYDIVGENSEILEHLGDLKTKQNKPDEAQKYYVKALELNPENEILKQKIKK